MFFYVPQWAFVWYEATRGMGGESFSFYLFARIRMRAKRWAFLNFFGLTVSMGRRG